MILGAVQWKCVLSLLVLGTSESIFSTQELLAHHNKVKCYDAFHRYKVEVSVGVIFKSHSSRKID